MTYRTTDHKDPGWWRRNELAVMMSDSDYCDVCGHIRGLHGLAGCLALSGALVNKPGRCTCLQSHREGTWRGSKGLAVRP